MSVSVVSWLFTTGSELKSPPRTMKSASDFFTSSTSCLTWYEERNEEPDEDQTSLLLHLFLSVPVVVVAGAGVGEEDVRHVARGWLHPHPPYTLPGMMIIIVMMMMMMMMMTYLTRYSPSSMWRMLPCSSYTVKDT